MAINLCNNIKDRYTMYDNKDMMKAMKLMLRFVLAPCVYIYHLIDTLHVHIKAVTFCL